jgi:hypothetical protein
MGKLEGISEHNEPSYEIRVKEKRWKKNVR